MTVVSLLLIGTEFLLTPQWHLWSSPYLCLVLTFTPAFSHLWYLWYYKKWHKRPIKCVHLYFHYIWQLHCLLICVRLLFTWLSPQGETWVLFVRNTRVNTSSFSWTSLCVVAEKGLHVLLWRYSPVVVRYHTACSDWMSSRISWMVLSPTADGNRIRILHTRP